MPQWAGKAILHTKQPEALIQVTQGVLVILPSCLLGFLGACIFLPLNKAGAESGRAPKRVDTAP